MNVYNTLTNQSCCTPLLAMTPFSTSVITQGLSGNIGLTGPNVELISFNSGDSIVIDSIYIYIYIYIVGLGIARQFLVANDIIVAQLGIVINQAGTLSNFEISYSADIISSDLGNFIEYQLFRIRAINNLGIDYASPPPVVIFFGTLDIPEILIQEQRSSNILITIPDNPTAVLPGDRIVLFVEFFNDEETLIFDSFSVGASVEFAPSII